MLGSSRRRRDAGHAGHGRRGRRRALVIAGVAMVVEIAGLWRRGYPLGGNVVVRCREGHLFTTIWVPGASVKSLRLGWRRFQWCSVGRHFSLVAPVRASELTEDERRVAGEHKDIRIP